MKPALQIAAILLVLLNAALLTPAATEFRYFLTLASLVIAFVIFAITLAPPRRLPAPKPAAAEALKPAVASVPQNQAQAEVVTLLGVFQEKGRFIDFLMEDITPYDDTQVGSVARSVHQGCKAALHEHFGIEPVTTAAEGSEITVPPAYAADEFRLIGNLAGDPPFKGKLVHKGWKTTSVKLPRVLNAEAGHLPAIAPAQVEIA